MEKLLRIKRVGDFRSLESWAPSGSLRIFGTYTLIYGANGTGKTTLASLLYELANGAEIPGLQMIVGPDEAQGRIVTSPTDRFWKSVHVFNTDYVAKNLRFEDAPGSTTEALLVLGEVNVENERERVDAVARLDRIDRDLPIATKASRAAATARDRLLTNTARTISEELQGASARFAGRSYRSTQVQGILNQGVPDAKGIDVAQDLKVVQGPAFRNCLCQRCRPFRPRA